MKLHEIYINETIKTFGPRSDWFDKAIEIYNAKGSDALFTYVARTLSIPITSVKLDFEADMDQYTTRDEAVEEWLIFLDEFSPSPLNANAVGGGAGGGASAGASAGVSAGGTTGATSSNGASGSADSGAGDSDSGSADSTPSVASVNRGLFIGSMAPKKKKKKKFKFGTGVYNDK